jgi:CheY-like chemotaxis protein
MSARSVILVVDDEPSVRQVAASALRRAGYEVLEASGGDEALVILAERPDVRLVMLDCRMPKMTGPELAKAILARWPAVRLVAASGDPRSPDLPAEATFLRKPFRPSVLREHVTERLQ